MSTITPVSSNGSSATISGAASSALGKDEFLQLLVAKMKFQDPLNPTSDEDFIAQLAQFSSLEQMQNMADAIAESNQIGYLQMQSLNNSMSANLIGKEVVASYDGVYYDGDKQPEISFTTEQYAATLDLVIRNEAGDIVARISNEGMPPGEHTLHWDGKDQLGNRAPDGYYTVSAEAVDANDVAFTPDLRLVGLVESISYRNGAAFLKVNGSEIALGDVVSVGEPGSFGG